MLCGNESSGLVNSSRCAISAALSVISVDLRLSWSWLTRLAPMIVKVTPGRRRTQASAIRAMVESCA